MTRYEFLKMNESIIDILLKNKIDPATVSGIKVYDDYKEMKKDESTQDKFVILSLAQKYNVSQRTIYNIVSRMDTNIDI